MNESHLAVLRLGQPEWDIWRKTKGVVTPDLSHANLRGENLSGFDLTAANLSGADLSQADLRKARLMGANLTKANLTNARLTEAVFDQADLSDAEMSGADLSGSDLDKAVIRRANLSNATLNKTLLGRAILCESDLSSCTADGAIFGGVDFTRTKLRDARFEDANFNGANFGQADLADAEFIESTFYHATLSDADLDGAVFNVADFTHADLRGVNFRGCYLANPVFYRTLLDRAKFAGLSLMGASISDTDLSGVTGLEHVSHAGPSSLSIDSLYQSKGAIPEEFLRGCGVPDSFITQVRALVGAEEGIQFYSCFISYSGKDEEFAARLHGRLQQEHVRVWFAPKDIQGGKKLHEQIEEAIRIFDKLLIVLSEHSLKSAWVMTELRKARKQERKTGKRKLFPVRLVDFKTLQEWECFDADGGQDLATEVREYFIPDFSDWKDHDSFENAFARLLKDLKAERLPAK